MLILNQEYIEKIDIYVGNLGYKVLYLQKKKTKMQNQGFFPTHLKIGNFICTCIIRTQSAASVLQLHLNPFKDTCLTAFDCFVDGDNNTVWKITLGFQENTTKLPRAIIEMCALNFMTMLLTILKPSMLEE